LAKRKKTKKEEGASCDFSAAAIFRPLFLLPLLLSCTQPPPQSPWKCLSGVKRYIYKIDNGESIQININFDERSADIFGKVENLHENLYRNEDMNFDVTNQLFIFGNLLISSDIFTDKKWSKGATSCIRTKVFVKDGTKTASVECSENRSLGFLRYSFDHDHGVTHIESYGWDKLEDKRLMGTEGLGKMCAN